jgi:hypothetical protein
VLACQDRLKALLIAFPETGFQPEDCDAHGYHALGMQPDNLHGCKRFLLASTKFLSKGKSGVSLVTATDRY